MVTREFFDKLLTKAQDDLAILGTPILGTPSEILGAPYEIEEEELKSTYERITDETKEYFLSQSPDDEGHAQCVNRLYRGKFLYCDALGWLYYNGQYWQHESVACFLDRAIVNVLICRRMVGVKAQNEKLIKATKPSAANVRNCKFLFQSLVPVNVNDFDNNPDSLNCDNGAVDLRNGGIVSHHYMQRFTYCLGTSYNPNADDNEWVEWLHSTVTPAGIDDNGEYIELVTWLQMAIGYSLTGHTHEHCLFFIHGPPRAGKGVFLQILTKLLERPLSTGVDFDIFIAKRYGESQNFDLAPLKSCRLIIATESDRNSMLNAKRVKSITGNDPVYCAHKHKDFFSYIPQYKIWLSSNFEVVAQADDDALWSRLRIITFPNSHLEKEEFGLEARLWANREGILKWAIDGAISWQKRQTDNIGLGRPAIIIAATQDHRTENDTVQQFINDCCVIGEDYRVPSAQFTMRYKTWCDENGMKPLGVRRLASIMRKKGYILKDLWIATKSTSGWFGIGLKS